MDKVSGLAEFQAALGLMQQDLTQALPAIVARAAGIIEREIASRAPERTGSLKSSIDTQQSVTENSATATVQVDDSGPNAKEHYAIFDEFGTSRMAARPFFRPGVEAGKEEAEAALINGVLQVVDNHAG